MQDARYKQLVIYFTVDIIVNNKIDNILPHILNAEWFHLTTRMYFPLESCDLTCDMNRDIQRMMNEKQGIPRFLNLQN